MSRYSQELASFLKDGTAFRIVYTTTRHFFKLSVARICILDSSFNPPHLGHFSLAANSLRYDYEARHPGQTASEERVLLLLLSVKNADKGVQPAAFEERIEMMHYMADHIASQTGVSVALALTNHAMFVHKAEAIQSYLSQEYDFARRAKLTFLMGYDTLIRVLHPKYYAPKSVAEALASFMSMCELFVLTRADGKTSLADQLALLEQIRSGESVPSEWYDRIYMLDGEDASIQISSSALRKAIGTTHDWKNQTIPAIADYIARQHLYSVFSDERKPHVT